MATKITNAALIAACEQMLTEGIKYTTLDCQAAVEEAYMRCGLSAKQVDFAGSNTHFRKCYWAGLPERFCEITGCKTAPGGCETYINADDGGEPAKYKSDHMGNSSHMGIYLGNGRTFNSSEKMGGVVVSTKFNGKKQAVSGSWNMIGLKSYVDYGLTADQIAAIKADGNFVAANYAEDSTMATSTDASTPTVSAGPVDTSDFYTVKRGCKGGAVRRLQGLLNDGGYTDDDGKALVVDGEFGAKTEAAVIKYQAAKGLKQDGIIGPISWKSLLG